MSREPKWKVEGYENIAQAIDDESFEFEEFSDELEKELRYLFKNGYDTGKLARKTGIFESAIRERLGLKQNEENYKL